MMDSSSSVFKTYMVRSLEWGRGYGRFSLVKDVSDLSLISGNRMNLRSSSSQYKTGTSPNAPYLSSGSSLIRVFMSSRKISGIGLYGSGSGGGVISAIIPI